MPDVGDMVVVIDDDGGIREAVLRLLSAAGLEARAFPSAEAFLDSDLLDHTSVLILDIQLPGLSGLALQQRLRSRGCAPPAIFITGQDLPHHRTAAGQLDSPCFAKPFHGLELVDAVRSRMPAA